MLAPRSPALFLTALTLACAGADPGDDGSGSQSAGGTDASGSAATSDGGTGAGTDGTSGGPGETDGGTTGMDAGTGGDGVDWDAELDHVFPQDRVVDIQLRFAPGDWDALLAEWDEQRLKTYYPARFQFDAEVLDEVGVRLKGYSSLVFGTGDGPWGGGESDPSDKFPLKINFDRFGGPRFHEIDKIALGNNWSDITYMRERLGHRMYDAMGVLAPRTAYARAQVDDYYVGAYTMVQPVDKVFLKAGIGTGDLDEGNLYKCGLPGEQFGGPSPCTLAWLGDTKSDYLLTQCVEGYDECGLVLKTNEDDPLKNDYADLIHFLDVLNNTPDDAFAAAIDQVFDVDGFLRYLAVTVAISSYDSYIGKANNYFLYHHPGTDKFMLIPWDLNMSYGGYGCGGGGPGGGANLITYDIHDPTCSEGGAPLPLVDRILDVPELRLQYLEYLREVAENWLTPTQQQAWIDEFDGLIGPILPSDPNYEGTPGQYAEAIGDQPAFQGYNLMDFVIRRQQHILDSL